jgi:Fe-S-cluster containining protein
MAKKTIAIRFDCSKCPGYCCSYPRIEVKDRDVTRLARHFGIDFETAAKRFTRIYVDDGVPERILRHRKDDVYGSICRFLDTELRRCGAYEARPTVCREYPNGSRCGYYEFLRFERKHQGDPDFVPLT